MFQSGSAEMLEMLGGNTSQVDIDVAIFITPVHQKATPAMVIRFVR